VIVVLVTIDANEPNVANIGTNFALFGIAWVIGDNIRVRRAYLQQLELRADETEQRQREAAERAVAEERLSIARELHDVVAHAMSVVTVQSGVGEHVIDQRPDEAKRILGNINVTSREALDEMRRLLGVLRAEDDRPEAVLAPAPTLEGVPALAATMESSGVPVTVEITGDRSNVPPGVDLSAYRIVQEALTNVLKHAGPAAAVTVSVAYHDDRVELVVADDGRGGATHVAAGTIDDSGGHGLVGMRERTAVYGGTLAVGPRRGGGFQVEATLPFTPVASPA
jgi:signal transduction histidine kinase